MGARSSDNCRAKPPDHWIAAADSDEQLQVGRYGLTRRQLKSGRSNRATPAWLPPNNPNSWERKRQVATNIASNDHLIHMTARKHH